MLEKMDVPASSDALPMSIKVLAIVAFVGTLAFVMFVILTIEGPEIERDHSYREPAYTVRRLASPRLPQRSLATNKLRSPLLCPLGAGPHRRQLSGWKRNDALARVLGR